MLGNHYGLGKIKLVLLQNPLYTETSIDQWTKFPNLHSSYIYIVITIAYMSYQALDINPIVQLDQQTSALSTWALTVHQACPKRPNVLGLSIASL